MLIAASAATAATPTLTINPASEIKYTGAHLSGTVDPEGGTTDPVEGTLPIRWEFQYSPDPLTQGWWPFGGEGTLSGAAAEGNSPVPVSANLTGAPYVNTKYKFRLVAYYAGDQVASSPEGEFDLAKVTPPGVAIDPVSAITGTTAHFSGTVTPGNADPAFNSECTFFFLTDAEFQPRDEQQRVVVAATGGTFPLKFTAPNGSSEVTAPIAFDASAAQVQAALVALAGIGPGDVIVSGGPGDEKGSQPYTIKFAGALAGANLAPLGSDGGALTGPSSGVVVSTLKEGHQGFEGAREIGCGFISGAGSTPVSGDPRLLLPGTTYHVRLRAANGGGPAVADTTFTTLVIAPRVRTGSTNPTASGAVLSGEVNPNGGETTYYFEYGPGFGQKTAEKTLTGAQAISVSATLSGLSPSTQYPYRLVASNSAGKATGADKVFTTTSGVVDPCPNAEFRFGAQANLPDCRAYELVNPPGLDYIDIVRMPAAGDDGNSTGISSMNAGNDAKGGQAIITMRSHRTEDGWVTVDANPPVTRSQNNIVFTNVLQFSADGRRALLRSDAPIHPDQVSGAGVFRLDLGSGQTSWLSHPQTVPGPGALSLLYLTPLGASPDLGTVAFEYQAYPPLLPEATGSQIYVSEQNVLRLASRLPDGTPTSAQVAATLWSNGITNNENFGSRAPHGGAHAVSENGQRIFFYADGGLMEYLGEANPPRTVAVTATERTGESGYQFASRFIGATRDGSIAYFESTARLTDAATPGGGIYRFKLDAPAGSRLEQVTPASPIPGGLQVSNAILSDDGSTLYFVTGAQLAAGAGEGVLNAYLWRNGSVRFIASFPTEANLERVSRDGGFALFRSIDSVDGASNAGFQAIYEYDAGSDDLACASCRPDGSPSQGDAFLQLTPSAAAFGALTNPRFVADDGTVFFVTRDRIAAADETARTDAYQYRDGKVSLLTSGHGERDVYPGDNSDDGKTVFVLTGAALLPQDGDVEELDVYAIRSGGGFPQPPLESAPCEGEACRGATSTPPPASAPVTPNFIGPGNSKSGRNQGPKKKKKKGKHNKKQSKNKKGKKGKGKGKQRAANGNGRNGR